MDYVLVRFHEFISWYSIWKYIYDNGKKSNKRIWLNYHFLDFINKEIYYEWVDIVVCERNCK